MRHPRKRDANEPAIVNALKAAGCSVTRLDETGVPDLLVGFEGRTLLLEVKVPGECANRRRSQGGAGVLTKAQVEWLAAWHGAPIAIVTSTAEALGAIVSLTSEP